MIYIFTAMYCEAQTFIRHFQLKKDTSHTRFQVFINEENGVCLTITGTGEIAAASAVSSICTEYGAGENDFLVNTGTCAGAADGQGRIYLCNKITELATGKTFYPDILYRHPFEEQSIVTAAGTLKRGMAETGLEENSCDILCDMEAAAVYQAGAYFFGPHQMFFIKMISDEGDGNVSSKQVERLMSNIEPVVAYIEQLIYLSTDAMASVDGKEARDCAWIQKLCHDMHCSKVMCDSLEQLIRYLTLSGTDYEPVMEEMYGAGLLPCKDKREGKLRLEELKRKLL